MVTLLLFLILFAIAPMLALGVLAVVGVALLSLGVVWLINNDKPAPAASKPVKQTRDPELYEWNEFDRIGAAKDWNRTNVATSKVRKG